MHTENIQRAISLAFSQQFSRIAVEMHRMMSLTKENIAVNIFLFVKSFIGEL
jgi:hypothetical protein